VSWGIGELGNCGIGKDRESLKITLILTFSHQGRRDRFLNCIMPTQGFSLAPTWERVRVRGVFSYSYGAATQCEGLS